MPAVVPSLLRSSRRTLSAILGLGPSAMDAAVSKTQNRTKGTRAALDSRCSGTTTGIVTPRKSPITRSILSAQRIFSTILLPIGTSMMIHLAGMFS